MKFLFVFLVVCFFCVGNILAEDAPVPQEKENICPVCPTWEENYSFIPDEYIVSINQDIRECKEQYASRKDKSVEECPKDIFRFKMRTLLSNKLVSGKEIEKITEEMDALNKEIRDLIETKNAACKDKKNPCVSDDKPAFPYIYYGFLSKVYDELGLQNLDITMTEKEIIHEKKIRKKYLGY